MSIQKDDFIELEAQLQLKDKISYNYIMLKAILTFYQSLLNEENSEREIRESILALVKSIPDAWKQDKEWQQDETESIIVKLVDVRPRFCGVPATLEYCRQHGIAPYKKQYAINYYRLQQAVFNLLDRRNMLSRRSFTEKMTGRRYKGRQKDVSEEFLEFI